ncbi:exosortase/archaeosortase family protein [Hufsiella ginkgonis]|uniref:Exosortase/archaeosortase family protein n=1 Tax=Hufsiella ginkgonis TaxID=2695274 RepID=A0A7K1Y1S4_9SPHI|nr:exosortase/archaeosortase family protein [Hufsiella ginkgonis]MXV17171.1 hypothetical protein [Hufsiella ginkgonis]
MKAGISLPTLSGVTKFLLVFLTGFLALYLTNLLVIGLSAPGGKYIDFVARHLNYIAWWRETLIRCTASCIEWLGWKPGFNHVHLWIPRVGGIAVSYSCLGYGVTSFLWSFVLAWPGKSWYARVFMILAGTILVQLLNIIRLTLITVYWQNSRISLPVSHHVLFDAVIYGVLLVILWRWTRKARNQIG